MAPKGEREQDCPESVSDSPKRDRHSDVGAQVLRSGDDKVSSLLRVLGFLFGQDRA